MGIPSYYKRLLDSVGGILQKTHPGSIDWLWMDFNCLIYHCLRRPGIPVYPGHADRIEWEKQFLECIMDYIQIIVKEVMPKKGVFLAVDGVVPMAKMRQQRLRRFKSAWLVTNGLAEGIEPGKESWDTNSITPGTVFMDKLATRLQQLCIKKSGKVRWWLSSSNEPGEGEHKIMEQWRTGAQGFTGSHTIYGLDADLIVLSLLNKSALEPVWLFREQIEMGTIVRNADGNESYTWFSIDKLGEHLKTQIGDRSMVEYCFAMSVLGNDFLPSSMSFKMREDGHESLLEGLRNLKEPLLTSDNTISKKGLDTLFTWLALSERARITQYITRKMGLGRNYTGLQIGDNNWPLSEKVESILIERRELVSNWDELYRIHWLGGGDKELYCKEYMYGIHWIWSYYTGNMAHICFNWCYPWTLPPLWTWLVDTSTCVEFPGIIHIRHTDILPTEQLCLVLPIDSWWLLSSSPQRRLVEKAPWFFPESFSFGSIGKRYFWECEAEIPVPSILEIKQILAR